MLNSTWLLLISVLAFFIVVTVSIIFDVIYRRRLKIVEKSAREWDAKVIEQWEKRNEGFSAVQAETAKKIAEELEAKRKKEAEILINLETSFADFFKSPENKFIEQFAKKYADETNQEAMSKLQLLLKSRQWDFSLYELKLLVIRECKRQNLENVESKIFSDASIKDRTEIIEAYLRNFHNDKEKTLEILAEILHKKDLFDGTLADLKTEIIKLEEKVEADKFAEVLLKDNSRA